MLVSHMWLYKPTGNVFQWTGKELRRLGGGNNDFLHVLWAMPDVDALDIGYPKEYYGDWIPMGNGFGYMTGRPFGNRS